MIKSAGNTASEESIFIIITMTHIICIILSDLLNQNLLQFQRKQVLFKVTKIKQLASSMSHAIKILLCIILNRGKSKIRRKVSNIQNCLEEEKG